MKRFLLLCVLVLLYATAALSQITSSIYFLDRFATYKNGSDGSPIWTPVKGVWQISGESYFQRSTEYDCASMYNVFLNESYEIEITFKQISGEPGVGLMFNSYQRSSTAFSQMIRFDGSSVFLLGYFSGGEFTATSSVKVDAFDTKIPHTLSLKVDRESDTYSVKLDGSILRANEPLVYRSGYGGLQSSGGEVQFTKFRLSRVEPGISPFDLTWTKNFIVTKNRQFIIPDEIRGIVRVLSPDSNSSFVIGAPVSEYGQFVQPIAVAEFDKNTIVVADRGANRVLLFDKEGGWIGAAGWKGKDRGTFDGISAVAVNRTKQIFVLEEANKRVQVLDESLKTITVFGSDRLIKPQGIAIEGSAIYVVNTGLSQVEKYEWDGKKATWRGFFSYGGGEGRGIAVQKGAVYLSVLNQVRRYDSTGAFVSAFSGRAIDFITPWGIALDSSGNIYASDFTGGRIVRIPPSVADAVPIVNTKNDGTATIEWNTTEKHTGSVIVTSDNDTVGVWKESKPATMHKVTVKKLNPLTSYRFHVSQPVWTMPLRKQFSRFFPFRTPAVAKQKQYARLPMATVIFTNVTDAALLRAGDTSVPPLPDTELERVKNQILDGIKFYWIHSGFNYFIDNEFIIVNDPVRRNEIFGSEWWYPPVDSMLEATLHRYGKDVRNYSGITYLSCTQQYDTTLRKYALAGKGGAFTNGVGTGKGYGISWWDVTRANHNAGNNWLFIHEYNHQLDDMFMMSGYPEYWFNHISPTIGTAADFGEHFDANRHILKIVPKEEWLDLNFTTIESTPDADNDGIPDDAPNLPLDEKRLVSDSKKADTDGDGVSDFDELTASNWLVEGWGETYGGKPVFPNPGNKDTDGDGISDKTDLYPCIPAVPEIQSGVAGRLFAEISDERIKAQVFARYDTGAVVVTLQTNAMVPIKLMLDGNTDGWFVGRDNILLTLTPANDSFMESKVQLFNATDPQQWPFMDTTLAKTYSVKTAYGKKGDSFVCEVQLPKNIPLGFDWKAGKKLGILIGFLCPFDSDGNKRYVNIFEPNRFFDVELR